jgi:acyl carrier protein
LKEVTINSILSIINENIESNEITLEQADEDLSLLGMDSIKFIQIVVALEESFQIEVPDEELLINKMGTINKILSVVSVAIKSANE